MKKQHIILATVLLASFTLIPACTTDMENINETGPIDTVTETVAITDTEAEGSDTEDETPTKPETPALDQYQGMTADIPYTLHYKSNGDGTCVVSGITANLLYEGTYTVEIPETSPDGETVIGLYTPNPVYNIPRYLTVEDYEILDGWIKNYVKKGVEQGVFENEFKLYQFRTNYVLRDATLAATPEEKDKLIAEYPLCEYMPMYSMYHMPPGTYAYISQMIESAAPWYTADWCYADLLSLQSVADSLGVKDGFLESCLAEHSYHLGHADAVRLPKTMTPRRENLDEVLNVLSYLGVNLVIYDGTVEEFKALMDVETPIMRPLTVRCTDGEITFEVSEPKYPVLAE